MTITAATTTTTTTTGPAPSGCGTPGCGALDVSPSGCAVRRLLCGKCQVRSGGPCDVGDLTDLYWLDVALVLALHVQTLRPRSSTA